ncbi:MAG: class I SAM-dependent methyltransferase [Robiginitalea sp.]|uniref:class I SAM-dependent methyltransferase n=1 Tax=Robiginitalea sp. TaxID=1902411 RepID=UPI003C791EA8
MDLLGKALQDFYKGRSRGPLRSHSSLGTIEDVPVSYFFRPFASMPALEQQALMLCRGSVLDIGCGAGSHCLYLQESGLDCTGLDTSPAGIKVATQRGVLNTVCTDIMDYHSGKFDTLLLLMNGIGIAGTLEAFPDFLEHLKGLLQPGGQILIDSSDLIYMFDTDEDGGVWVPAEVEYYGEVRYKWEYSGDIGPEFSWLFLDLEILSQKASSAGFEVEWIKNGPHFDYLARLTPIAN